MNANSLKRSMKEKKISISQLARKANIGQATVSEILSGVRKDIKLETAKKIANALDLTLENLCEGE